LGTHEHDQHLGQIMLDNKLKDVLKDFATHTMPEYYLLQEDEEGDVTIIGPIFKKMAQAKEVAENYKINYPTCKYHLTEKTITLSLIETEIGK